MLNIPDKKVPYLSAAITSRAEETSIDHTIIQNLAVSSIINSL